MVHVCSCPFYKKLYVFIKRIECLAFQRPLLLSDARSMAMTCYLYDLLQQLAEVRQLREGWLTASVSSRCIQAVIDMNPSVR